MNNNYHSQGCITHHHLKCQDNQLNTITFSISKLFRLCLSAKLHRENLHFLTKEPYSPLRFRLGSSARGAPACYDPCEHSAHGLPRWSVAAESWWGFSAWLLPLPLHVTVCRSWKEVARGCGARCNSQALAAIYNFPVCALLVR